LLQKTITTFRKEGLNSLFKKAKRTVQRIYKQAGFEPYIITKMFEGETLQFLIGDVIGEEWYTNYPGFREFQWIKENLSEGDIVVDCGAHHGLTGLLFSRWVGPTGKVIGFEGLPHNVEIACKNIELNHVNNFEMRNEAVGPRKGTARFVDELCGVVGGTNNRKTIEVTMVSLDEAFRQEKPTFLKIDVEGYELEVLRGAREVMATCPKLDLEIHCARFKDCSEAVRELLSLLPLQKYQTFIQLVLDGEVIPYDPGVHTPELIATYENIHLLACPKNS
jgi:FkbM family methyltransferase